MPANYGLLYEEVFGVSPTVTVIAIEVPKCPICGAEFPTAEARDEHIKTAHPLQWYFWYAPYGKPLLASAIVVVGAGLTVVTLKAVRKR